MQRNILISIRILSSTKVNPNVLSLFIREKFIFRCVRFCKQQVKAEKHREVKRMEVGIYMTEG